MNLIISIVNGKFRNYTEVRVPVGYYFYDVDEEERQYMTYIATPILDETEIIRKFVVVEGDADKLNEELQKEIVEE